MVPPETGGDFGMKMINWKEAIEWKGLKVNIGKTKVMCSQKEVW